jgi:hypothetical protein
MVDRDMPEHSETTPADSREFGSSRRRSYLRGMSSPSPSSRRSGPTLPPNHRREAVTVATEATAAMVTDVASAPSKAQVRDAMRWATTTRVQQKQCEPPADHDDAGLEVFVGRTGKPIRSAGIPPRAGADGRRAEGQGKQGPVFVRVVTPRAPMARVRRLRQERAEPDVPPSILRAPVTVFRSRFRRKRRTFGEELRWTCPCRWLQPCSTATDC